MIAYCKGDSKISNRSYSRKSSGFFTILRGKMVQNPLGRMELMMWMMMTFSILLRQQREGRININVPEVEMIMMMMMIRISRR